MRATLGRGSDGSERILGAVGALTEGVNYVKALKEKLSAFDLLGDKSGLDHGPLANIHNFERKAQILNRCLYRGLLSLATCTIGRVLGH